jgi:hypothetical protein
MRLSCSGQAFHVAFTTARQGVGVGQGRHNAVEPGVHRVGIGLVEDSPDLGGHVRLRTFGHSGEQVAQVVAVMPTSA